MGAPAKQTIIIAFGSAMLLAMALLFVADHYASVKGVRSASSSKLSPLTYPSGHTRGQIQWNAFGMYNFSGNEFNQWSSYSQFAPADDSSNPDIRATSPNIPPGDYVLDFQAQISWNCNPAQGFPACTLGNPNVTLCPHLGIYISCPQTALRQYAIQPNFCLVGQVPPQGYQTCMGPPGDGVNSLIAFRYFQLNTLSSPSGTAAVNTAGLGSPQYIDFSAATMGNCSLILNVADPCNARYLTQGNYRVSFYFNMYSPPVQYVSVVPN